MKVAVIGSRSITHFDMGTVLPSQTTEIVSGGAKGIDQLARNYALTHHLKLTEFLPQYNRYGRGAPLKRNQQIVDYADFVLIIWDGQSKGTAFVRNLCEKQSVAYHLILCIAPADN